jgi:hypothetical protein
MKTVNSRIKNEWAKNIEVGTFMAIADVPEIKGDVRFNSISIPRHDAILGANDTCIKKYIFGFSKVIEKTEIPNSHLYPSFMIVLDNGTEWRIWKNCKYVVKAELEVK